MFPWFHKTTISRPSVESHLTSGKHRPVLLPASQRALQRPSMPFFSVFQIPEETWSPLICVCVCVVCAESMEWTSCAFLCLHWNNILLINTSYKCLHVQYVCKNTHTHTRTTHRGVWEYSYRVSLFSFCKLPPTQHTTPDLQSTRCNIRTTLLLSFFPRKTCSLSSWTVWQIKLNKTIVRSTHYSQYASSITLHLYWENENTSRQ